MAKYNDTAGHIWTTGHPQYKVDGKKRNKQFTLNKERPFDLGKLVGVSPRPQHGDTQTKTNPHSSLTWLLKWGQLLSGSSSVQTLLGNTLHRKPAETQQSDAVGGAAK